MRSRPLLPAICKDSASAEGSGEENWRFCAKYCAKFTLKCRSRVSPASRTFPLPYSLISPLHRLKKLKNIHSPLTGFFEDGNFPQIGGELSVEIANREFKIDGIIIPTADKKDMVILGMFIPDHRGLKEIGDRMLDNVATSLKIIHNCPVRSEIKAEIFSKYYVPGLQNALTIQTVGASHHNTPSGRGISTPEKIDALELRRLRNWLKIPKSATRSVFTSAVFNLKQILKLA